MANIFSFDAHIKNADFGKKIIEETHQFWYKLSIKSIPNGKNLAL